MAIKAINDPRRGKLWQISYCDSEGKRHREKFSSKSLAEDALGKRRREIAEGRYFPPRGGKLKFRDLAKAMLAHKKLRLAPSTYRTYTGLLEQLYPLIGNLPADRLTPARIRETLDHFLRQGKKQSTVNRFHAVGSAVYTYGKESERIVANPFGEVRRFPEKNSRTRWLTDEEENRLKDAFVQDSHEWEFILALHTGMRRGEQFSLLWENVDFKNNRLTVYGKTGERRIPLNTKALEVLGSLQKLTGNSPRVCPDAREAKRDWRRWFEAACKKAKPPITNFHWHDLRHTFASRLVMEGVAIPAVQALLGHADIKMTMRYAHLAPSHLDDAVQKMVAKKEDS